MGEAARTHSVLRDGEAARTHSVLRDGVRPGYIHYNTGMRVGPGYIHYNNYGMGRARYPGTTGWGRARYPGSTPRQVPR